MTYNDSVMNLCNYFTFAGLENMSKEQLRLRGSQFDELFFSPETFGRSFYLPASLGSLKR